MLAADAGGMSFGQIPDRPVSAGGASAATGTFWVGVETAQVGHRAPLTVIDRACCCPAAACVRVVLPATAARRHETELLLCAHHYRRSRAVLAELGGRAFDRQGAVVAGSAPLFATEC